MSHTPSATRAVGGRESRVAWAALALLTLLLLAGCSAAPAQPVVEVAPGQTVSVSEPPKPTLGTVSGIVGDDALHPLPGVAVTVLSLNVTATTGSGGQFAIVNVPEGVWIVEGSLKDHQAVQTTVEVEAGKVAKAVLLLPRLPPTDPYRTTFKADGYVTSDLNGLLFGHANATVSFQLDHARAATIVAEARVDGLTSLDPQPLDYSLQPPADPRPVLEGPAANPLLLRIDPRVLPPGRADWDFQVVLKDLAPTVAVQAHQVTVVTVFYNQPAPDGWSMLAGSP